MAAKDFIYGNPSPEDEPNKYKWLKLEDIMQKWRSWRSKQICEDSSTPQKDSSHSCT